MNTKNILSPVLLLLLAFNAHSQETNTINVSGSIEYEVKPTYEASMVLSLVNVYYDVDSYSVEDLKSRYFEKIKGVGISTQTIKEDALGYTFLGYEKEGVLLRFETTSIKELEKFLTIQSIGVRRYETLMKYELSNDEMAEYGKKAYDDAFKKAELLAGKIGRKVGKATYVSDNNYQEYSEALYYASNSENRTYSISVSFELI
ncbi:MAG: SIMPL domain-containing protein [Bacteroidota bacterium]